MGATVAREESTTGEWIAIATHKINATMPICTKTETTVVLRGWPLIRWSRLRNIGLLRTTRAVRPRVEIGCGPVCVVDCSPVPGVDCGPNCAVVCGSSKASWSATAADERLYG